MAMVFRKKPTSVIRTSASKPSNPFDWRSLIKPVLWLFALLLAYVVYSNGADWVEKWDKTPIKSYGLVNQPRFTQYADISQALLKKIEISPLVEDGEPTVVEGLKGYFGQDIKQVKDRLLTLPWVKSVIVRKSYPDRLQITLLEHQPAAVWNDVGLVSDEGVVFNLPKDRFDANGLPILYGPDSEAKKVLEAWYKIQKDLQSRNLVLKSVATDIRGAWTITLDNGVELRLGRGDWLPKIDRFVTIFPEIDVPDGKRLAYVDLRYEHGAAVGFYSQ